ncbi:hypothetical protein BcepSauron_425 [Burkholderia phage BcepSauron]|uniref:Uncharacterized protein n=1 Tax=Burkholderia phage BcepSauron TaxID=2530033 RepID=A0A482MM96_9CAUD|nr:hypothetical protein H1O17_gp425 [Burkholderia phage BcepSauron]QBQ74805.1 hypothetical protein BcepSauron_425 [Burkholderia phage BcepSauron]
MFMLVLLLVLNFGISWWNCYAVGGIWNESKGVGGFSRVLAWSAAIQSVVGFSSVFGFIMGAVLYKFGYLPATAAQAAMNLWYLLIIFPALGSGLIITIHSWIVAYRERSLLSMGGAAYNSFAQAYNMYNAFQNVGGAFSGVKDFFGDVDLFDSDDPKAAIALLVIGLVIASILSGGVLTFILIRKYANRLPVPEGLVKKDLPLRRA